MVIFIIIILVLSSSLVIVVTNPESAYVKKQAKDNHDEGLPLMTEEKPKQIEIVENKKSEN